MSGRDKNSGSSGWKYDPKSDPKASSSSSSKSDPKASSSSSSKYGGPSTSSSSSSKYGGPSTSSSSSSKYGGPSSSSSSSSKYGGPSTSSSSSSKYGGPSGSSSTGGESSNVVGVFGMKSGTSRDEINQKFSKYGHIEKNFMVMDRSKDQHNPTFKGFAYLTFKEKEEAARAIKGMHGSQIQGRQVTVEPAASKPHWERSEKDKIKKDDKDKYGGGSSGDKDRFGRDKYDKYGKR